MKCPKCFKKIDEVLVVSECHQRANIDKKGQVVSYGDTLPGDIEKILCPKCQATITRYIKEL